MHGTSRANTVWNSNHWTNSHTTMEYWVSFSFWIFPSYFWMHQAHQVTFWYYLFIFSIVFSISSKSSIKEFNIGRVKLTFRMFESPESLTTFNLIVVYLSPGFLNPLEDRPVFVSWLTDASRFTVKASWCSCEWHCYYLILTSETLYPKGISQIIKFVRVHFTQWGGMFCQWKIVSIKSWLLTNWIVNYNSRSTTILNQLQFSINYLLEVLIVAVHLKVRHYLYHTWQQW